MRGLGSKLLDGDFLNLIDKYDFLLFTETWFSKLSNTDIKGFSVINCPRQKCNKKAKRDSGGVVVYYKDCFIDKIQLVKNDSRGIIWFKLLKQHFGLDQDTFIGLCYIPPENSSLYKYPTSELFECDLYSVLNDDILLYSDQGNVYLLGDFNARTGQKQEFVDNLGLNRFVNMPDSDDSSVHVDIRKSNDTISNSFGNKLLGMCKDNNMFLLNGRLEPGKFTCFSTDVRNCGSSVVDYVVTSVHNFDNVNNFQVNDLSEFSDHCSISFCLKCFINVEENIDNEYVDKIKWDCDHVNEFNELLLERAGVFDAIVNDFVSDNVSTDECINSLSSLIAEISFDQFGSRIRVRNPNRINRSNNKVPWFDDDCREAKRRFFNSKHLYKINPSQVNKIRMLEERNIFAKLKRNKKYKYNLKQRENIAQLSKSNPRKFWKYINSSKNNKKHINSNVSESDFVKYFSTLFQNQTSNENYNDTDNESNINIESLDRPFTVEEIIKTISTMKRNKSAGNDTVLPDFFIDSKHFIAPYLCKIYNKIYESGVYPEQWTKSIIVPIYKKGDRTNPANYRGISLINSMSKIFSLCLRNRLNHWCETEQVLNDSQFGFRDKRSTVDCVFILNSIIQKVLSNNKKLYCAFIDYKSCFDTITTDALWVKLVQTGVSCKFLNMLKSLYIRVSSCVKTSSTGRLSDYFNIAVGLKQGEPLSPLLLFYL